MDAYRVTKNGVICRSKSGNEYRVIPGYCSCKGYSYRRTCRHYEYCIMNGLFAQYEQRVREEELSGKFNSDLIVNMRKKGLRDFLDGLKVKYEEWIIEKLEKKIKVNTDPKKVVRAVEILMKRGKGK